MAFTIVLKLTFQIAKINVLCNSKNSRTALAYIVILVWGGTLCLGHFATKYSDFLWYAQ